MRQKALRAQETAILSKLDELKRQQSATLLAEEQALLREIAEHDRKQAAQHPVQAVARALPRAPVPEPEPEPELEPEPEPEPQRELIEF